MRNVTTSLQFTALLCGTASSRLEEVRIRCSENTHTYSVSRKQANSLQESTHAQLARGKAHACKTSSSSAKPGYVPQKKRKKEWKEQKAPVWPASKGQKGMQGRNARDEKHLSSLLVNSVSSSCKQKQETTACQPYDTFCMHGTSCKLAAQESRANMLAAVHSITRTMFKLASKQLYHISNLQE